VPKNGRKRGRVLSGAAALTLGVTGIGLGTAASAFAAPPAPTFSTAPYVIGTATSSVTAVTASVGNGVASSGGTTRNGLYSIGFTTPTQINPGDVITITDSDGNAIVSAATSIALVYQSGGATQLAQITTHSGTQFTVPAGNTIPAGAAVTIDFTAANPAAGTYSFTVSTPYNSAATSPGVTISATAPGFTATASSAALGAVTQYTFDNIGPLSAAANTVTITATDANVVFPQTGYTVTAVTSAGVSSSVSVSAVSVGSSPGSVTLTLGTVLPAGDTINVTAPSVKNPTAGTVTTETFTATVPSQTFTNTSTVNYGSAVTNVTASPSPASAGSSGTYTLSFTPSTSYSSTGTGGVASDTINITLPAGATAASGGTALITDPTDNTQDVVTYTAPASGSNVITLNLTNVKLTAGHAVTVLITGITNPTTIGATTLGVSTGPDTLAVNSGSFTITPAASSAVTVTVTPNTPGYTATYTINGFTASAQNLGSGSATTAGTLTLEAPAGTIFPAVASDYTLTDVTTPAGSGTVTVTPVPTNSTTSGTDSYVTITAPDAFIASGDKLSLTVTDVGNPGPGTYNMALAGSVAPTTVATNVFPHADLTFPNGSFVQYGGTVYVYVGGHPFGIPTQGVLAQLEQRYHNGTVIVEAASAVVPTTATRVGTLIQPMNGNGSTIYVVGTDGTLHGFGTPTQLLSNGYDPMAVLPVPNTLGITNGANVGTSTTAYTAFATTSDGALINSSGTFYELVGGKAFGIPTPASLAAIQAVDPATPLTGVVTSSLTGAVPANGTMIQPVGSAGIWVVFNGVLFPFKTPAQLIADGYAGGNTFMVPNTGGLTANTSYTGS
jgi:hypothetical protein